MTFHQGLNQLSLQQTSAGQLPAGLLKEIDEATKLGKEIFKKISKKEIQDIDLEVYKNPNYYSKPTVEYFSNLGLYSKWLPKMFGGEGVHPLAFYGLNLEMGANCLGISNLIGAHYVALGLVSATNSFSVLTKIIKDIKANKTCVALAVTEPSAGSDMEEAELLKNAKVCTLAKKVKDGFLISGQKIFISNSLFADWLIVSAFEDLKRPHESLVIFAVKSSTSGIKLGRCETKLGQNASPASVVFFEDVFVANEDVCFSRSQFQNDNAFKSNSEFLLNDLLSLSRAGVGCLATGAQKRILEIMMEHYQNKKLNQEWAQLQISKVLQNFIVSKTVSWEGHVQCYSRGPYKDLQSPMGHAFFKYMPTFIQTATIGVMLQSNSARDSLRKKRRESIAISDEKLIFGWGALTKSFCSDKAMESAYIALELIGCDGGEAFWEMEKLLRDIKLLQIYEGTNELNNLVAFKSFMGPEKSEQRIFQESV